MANATNPGSGETLFPLFAPTISSLARSAGEAELVAGGHLTEFRAMRVRGVLNKSSSRRGLSLAYSINPYRGCEFGCQYCYARYTHEFLASAATDDEAVPLRDPLAFERRIFIKQGAPWLLEQELRRVQPNEEIALGTATDPYQPAERWAKVTQDILRVFARRSGYRLGIVTKSQLIERDVELLREIGERNTLVVLLTVTTVDTTLARLLEPRAPRPDLRLQAVSRLRAAGITTGVLCSPLLPGITDGEKNVNEVARRAREADASFFAAEPLFLKSCSRPTFLSFVREHFPALEARYSEQFGSADFVSREYREAMREMVARVCRRHGLQGRSMDALLTRVSDARKGPEPERGGLPQQLSFGRA